MSYAVADSLQGAIGSGVFVQTFFAKSTQTALPLAEQIERLLDIISAHVVPRSH